MTAGFPFFPQSLVAAAAMSLLPAVAAPQDPVMLYYNDRPPYIVELPDGSAAGLTATPAGNAFRAAGIPVVWICSRQVDDDTIGRLNSVIDRE